MVFRDEIVFSGADAGLCWCGPPAPSVFARPTVRHSHASPLNAEHSVAGGRGNANYAQHCSQGDTLKHLACQLPELTVNLYRYFFVEVSSLSTIRNLSFLDEV